MMVKECSREVSELIKELQNVMLGEFESNDYHISSRQILRDLIQYAKSLENPDNPSPSFGNKGRHDSPILSKKLQFNLTQTANQDAASKVHYLTTKLKESEK